MSQQSFRALGVSAEVDQALAARDITSPFRIQSLVLADALAGRDVLAKSPTGSGKTLAFALPIVERTTPGEVAGGARPRSDARARAAGHRRDRARRGAEAAARRDRLRRRAARRAGQARERRARRRRHAGPPPGSARPAHDLARPRPDPRPRRGRPDARHGLQAAGREDPPAHAARAADDALLRDARRRGRRAGARVHAERRRASRRTADGQRARRGRAQVRLRHAPTRRSRRSSRSSSASATSHSSSCAPSAAPSVSSRSSSATRSTPARCTAT